MTRHCQVRDWNFTLFFNYKDEPGKLRAEKWREDSSIYLREIFQRVARFSAVAEETSDTSLRLKGFVSMKNRCTESHVKKILGKYSHCKPATFGDVLNTIQCFAIDRQTSLTGRLGDEDAKTIMRVMRDSERWERTRKGNEKTVKNEN